MPAPGRGDLRIPVPAESAQVPGPGRAPPPRLQPRPTPPPASGPGPSLPALAALGGSRVRFDASAQLRRRPLGPVVDALRALDADIAYEGTAGHLPLTVRGGALRGGTLRLDAGLSSQFLTSNPGGISPRIPTPTDTTYALPVSGRPDLRLPVPPESAQGVQPRPTRPPASSPGRAGLRLPVPGRPDLRLPGPYDSQARRNQPKASSPGRADPGFRSQATRASGPGRPDLRLPAPTDPTYALPVPGGASLRLPTPAESAHGFQPRPTRPTLSRSRADPTCDSQSRRNQPRASSPRRADPGFRPRASSGFQPPTDPTSGLPAPGRPNPRLPVRPGISPRFQPRPTELRCPTPRPARPPPAGPARVRPRFPVPRDGPPRPRPVLPVPAVVPASSLPGWAPGPVS
ncbi:hypothetical protein [Streptomyces sp. NPDC001307]|uniref:hypothetical protein n=1 Tax=Streptomyces sp. NPDC001307 TaxID=3364560 RepID=UPI00368E3E9C